VRSSATLSTSRSVPMRSPHRSDTAKQGPGQLSLVATPIGNLEDITYRAVRVLQEADLVAAEDTRTARVLFARYQITTPTVSLFEGNEQSRTPMLLDKLRAGAQIAIISEAGTPLVSDPGLSLVRACIAEQIPVDAVPGPSAVTTALLLSGFAPTRFRFVGFLPRRGGARERLLTTIAADPDAVVLFESPRRLESTLEQLHALIGPRPLVIARELTKRHQEVRRGTAYELLTSLQQSPARGEVTLVISERSDTLNEDRELPLVDLVAQHLAAGDSPRETAKQLSELGYSKRTAYQLALDLTRKDKQASS
jgi:16S rRNA (cytidine1402-2'-O)-methyltransferase